VTLARVLFSLVIGAGLVLLAYLREYGSKLLQSDFRLDFSRSGWALSGSNTAILFLGLLILLVFVVFPLCVSSFGNSVREEWSRRTGLSPDQNPLEFFEIKKRKRNG
jgi:hypothetical protein